MLALQQCDPIVECLKSAPCVKLAILVADAMCDHGSTAALMTLCHV